jgi:hypothetical protein
MKTILLICLLIVSKICMAQGCSDAGFCTMGAMRPNQKFSDKLNLKIRTIEYTSYAGVTDFKFMNSKIYDYFLSQIIDANIGLSNKSTIQIKLPLNTTIGNIANVTGLSDLSISGTTNILTNRKWVGNATIGFKIPLGKPNYSAHDGKPLPMYYQPTLGTYDIITGLSMSSSKWLIATGLQSPLTYNKNEFIWAPWNKTSDSAKINVYPRSNALKRGYDIMLRVERNFRFSKWNSYIGLLPIYRLKKDEFLNPKSNQYEPVEGSSGLAMTLLIGGGYKITVHSGLKILIGTRVVKRKTNADGLSRLAVTSISYEYTF